MRTLPWRNLRGYPARTAALLTLTTLMAVAAFGGGLVIQGVRQGLDLARSRLGADVLVTPEDTGTGYNPQQALLTTEPDYFYMDADVVEQVAATPGVERVSAQLYLASAKSSCCSARLQLIAFDPATDFTIQPWIAQSRGGTGGAGDGVGAMEVVVGANVTVSGTLTLFDHELRIAGQLAPSGTSLDNAVYMNRETFAAVLKASFDKNLNRYGHVDADDVVSAVTVGLADGADPDVVAAAIAARVPGVTVTTASGMVAGVAASLESAARTVTVLVALIWGLGLAVTVLVHALVVHERRRELATLTALGAGRRAVGRTVVAEAVIVNLAGALAGIVAAGVVVTSFATAIGQALGVGLVLPGAGAVALTAVATLAGAVLAAALSAAASLHRTHRVDPSLVLKEGE
ncbi:MULTISPECIES: ABC transporter permease [unclassified Actinomyces]|uniref:ABC transporter permease n=1 Tax=unclassified Actinomyces TaxID=2609248 RepID=UPI002016BAD4|nr:MULTISPECIES: ABC transporter permease [unclassified Actinomyces]